MSSLPLQAILFDCDGVIADSEGFWNEIDREHLAAFGVPDYDGRFKPNVIGKSFFLSSSFYRDSFGIAASVDELIEHRTRIARGFYAERIPVFGGAPEILDELRASGLKLALATSSVSRLIEPFLERHDLTRRFDAIITGEMVKQGKPHPDIYLLAAREVGVAPENCLVVEDALAGLQAGRAANCRTVAIPDARWLDPEAFVDKCDFRLESLGELGGLVRSLRPRAD